MKKVLVTWAIADEAIAIESRDDKIITLATGIGKASAAVAVANALNRWQPHLVVNIGTAGTLRHAVGDVLVCDRFVDRDYAKAQLPGLDYRIDMTQALFMHGAAQQWPSLQGGKEVSKRFVCNTGDDFVTNHEETEGDVFDMEAYAQALAARQAGVPFVAVKYVTDVIGQNSVKAWQEKLADARAALTAYFAARGGRFI